MIVTNQYVIYRSKIFYLRSEKPFTNGIMDYEDLSVPFNDNVKSNHLEFISGPIEVYGATRFQVIYFDRKI